jgi:chloride channel 3/4/5
LEYGRTSLSVSVELRGF